MTRNWFLVPFFALASCTCRGYPKVGCGREPDGMDAEKLGMRRVAPCTYDYNPPVAWWRGGFAAVEINGLATMHESLKIDEVNRRVSFSCTPAPETGRLRYGGPDGGEPTDVVILYIYD